MYYTLLVMMRRLLNVKFVRFVCVGVFNTTLDFLILNILAFIVRFPVLVANVISVCFGVIVSYYLNHHFVFKHHKSPSVRSFVKFFIVTGASIVVVQTAIIAITTPLYSELMDRLTQTALNSRWIDYQHQIAVNLAKATAVLAGMFWNFALYSKVVFKESDHSDTDLVN